MLSTRPTRFPPILPIWKWTRLDPSRAELWLKPMMKASMDRLEIVVLPILPLMVMVLVAPTLQQLAASPASLAALMAAQVLEFRVLLKMFTWTVQVLFAGALWLVPAATLMVMVAVPNTLPVTVTVVPDTLTVATLVLLEVAVMAPSPARVTAMVLAVVALFSVMLDLFRDRLPAAFPMVQLADFAVVVPSLHL